MRWRCCRNMLPTDDNLVSLWKKYFQTKTRCEFEIRASFYLLTVHFELKKIFNNFLHSQSSVFYTSSSFLGKIDYNEACWLQVKSLKKGKKFFIWSSILGNKAFHNEESFLINVKAEAWNYRDDFWKEKLLSCNVTLYSHTCDLIHINFPNINF